MGCAIRARAIPFVPAFGIWNLIETSSHEAAESTSDSSPWLPALREMGVEYAPDFCTHGSYGSGLCAVNLIATLAVHTSASPLTITTD